MSRRRRKPTRDFHRVRRQWNVTSTRREQHMSAFRKDATTIASTTTLLVMQGKIDEAINMRDEFIEKWDFSYTDWNGLIDSMVTFLVAEAGDDHALVAHVNVISESVEIVKFN